MSHDRVPGCTYGPEYTPEDVHRIEKRRNLMALYEVIKLNPLTRQSINWEKFAEHAESVGLHYHPQLGLMNKRDWEMIKPLLKDQP